MKLDIELIDHRIQEKLDLDVAEDNSGDYETVRKDRQCTKKKQVCIQMIIYIKSFFNFTIWKIAMFTLTLNKKNILDFC